jgi:hypothetical protein
MAPMGERHDHCDHDPIECSYDALVGEYQEAVAERDRLRAVVGAVRRAGLAVLDGIDWQRATGKTEPVPINRLADLQSALEQLDGSTDMGGG